MKNFFDIAILIIDENRGIYAAKQLVNVFESDQFPDMPFDDYMVLKSGPDNEEYFYVSESIEGMRVFINGDPHILTFVSGAIYVYPEGVEFTYSEVD